MEKNGHNHGRHAPLDDGPLLPGTDPFVDPRTKQQLQRQRVADRHPTVPLSPIHGYHDVRVLEKRFV